MSKSSKAALLSALVFPGAGHLFLKNRITGVVLASASLVAFYLIISKMVERAQDVFAKVESGEIGLDLAAISESVSGQSAANESQLLDMAWAILIICWLIGIVDSYRRGRAHDKSDMDR